MPGGCHNNLLILTGVLEESKTPEHLNQNICLVLLKYDVLGGFFSLVKTARGFVLTSPLDAAVMRMEVC